MQLLKLTLVVFLFFLENSNTLFGQKRDLNLLDESVSKLELSKLPAKGPYFLVDDRIIEDRWMIERFVVPFKKNSNNPVLVKDSPWEGKGILGGATLFDPQDHLFKIWYSIFDYYAYENKLPFSYNICYAESEDGIKWKKPILDLFDLKGKEGKKNNIIKLGWDKTQDIDIEFNPSPKSPAEKFIAIHNDNGGVFISYSADGKDFKSSFKNPAVSYHSDTRNNFVYDEVNKRWLMFVRPKAYAGEGIKHVNRRRVAVTESNDLVNWTHERTVLVPEEKDMTDFYGMTVFRRGDLFFGFLQVYDNGNSDKMYSELTWSNDGYHWYRLPLDSQRSPLNLGRNSEWDAGQIYITDKPIVKDDEMWFYYAGNKTPHSVLGSPAIGLAKTKLDRFFGSRSLPDTIGRILTRPFKVNGDLVINADAKGEIRVEVHSAIRNEVLEGWSFDDCKPFMGSELNAPIRWGNKKLSDLKGKVIRLRFQLEDGTLYSFDIL